MSRKIQKNLKTIDFILNEKLLEDFIQLHNSNSLQYELHLDKKQYVFSDVEIVKSVNPVSSPTLRGGVYVSGKFDYKITGTISDPSVMPLLSKTMLGPNTDFSEIKITTSFEAENVKKNYSLFAYLTNSMQNPSKVSLRLSVARLEAN